MLTTAIRHNNILSKSLLVALENLSGEVRVPSGYVSALMHRISRTQGKRKNSLNTAPLRSHYCPWIEKTSYRPGHSPSGCLHVIRYLLRQPLHLGQKSQKGFPSRELPVGG